MKQKIICIGVAALFLLVMFPVFEATEIKSNTINKEAFNENNDEITITVQTFYDNIIRNGVWDEDETAALNIHIWAGDNWCFQVCIFTYEGRTNGADGTLTFTVPKDWTHLYLYASQDRNIKLSRYKGVANMFSPQDGLYIEIPLFRVESYSAAKTTTHSMLINILTRLIEKFPILQQPLLNL